MKDAYLRIKDEYLYFRHNGIRSGRKTLLFVHGMGDSGLSFKDVFKDRRFADLNLIVPDLIGYGRSSATEKKERYRYSYHVDRLWKLVDDRGLDEIILIGHSMGGDLTTLMCESDTRGIISKYVNIEGDITQFDLTISSAAVRAHKEGRFDKWFEDGLKKKLIFDSMGHLRSGRIYFASLSFCRPEALLENAIELVKRNTSLSGKYKSEIGQLYCSLSVPRVFCYGTDSLTDETLAYLKENEMRVKAFEGVGHCPMTDSVAEFYSFLYDFI